MGKIFFAGSKLIYTREFRDVLFKVGKKKMHLSVELEGYKIIRHMPESDRDFDVWNSLTTEQRLTEIDSILKDEFEF